MSDMVSILKAPRPADFRPSMWPADWQLWREDKFDTPGTIYDPTMWSYRAGSSGGVNFGNTNITECPGGGLRLIGNSVLDVGTLVFTGPEIFSANWYGNEDNHGRGSSNITNQQYLPPYMITFRARYSEISIAVVQLPVRFGGWIHTHIAELKYLNATLGNPDYDDTQVGLEFDGDERQVGWGGHSHTNYLVVRTNAGSSSPGGSTIETGNAAAAAGTIKDVWYEVCYLCHRNHEGRMFVRSCVNNDCQQTFIDTPITMWPDRLAIHEMIFDRNSHVIHFMAWVVPGSIPLGFDQEQQVTYDVRDFRVYVPPGDPRLGEVFKSNSPSAAPAVPTFWSIVGSVTGTILNLTITDAVPRATWDVSVVEDDPVPSPPVTLASTHATRVWTLGTRNVAVPEIDVSSLDPAKDLAVSVTHGGRTRTIVVVR